MFSTIGYYICIPFAALLRLFYNLTSSYGLSLIFFTLVIKLVLLPFQMKSKKSMVRMNRMSGKMQEIQKKYANNQMKMNEEMQKFYAEEGINPMSGCLWSFLPMPIMIALYYIIREPVVFFMNFGSRAANLEVLQKAKDVITSLNLNWSTLANGNDGAYAQIEIIQHIASNAENPIVKAFLAENPNHVFTKEELFNKIWDMESVGDIATVTVHIKKIREKIEFNTAKPQYIETIWGVGYRFKV